MVDFGLRSSNGGVLYRGNDEVLGEMLSKFPNPCFFFAITWSFLIQIE